MDAVSKYSYHILVVDDEEGIRRMLETKLFHVGYRVSTAGSAKLALQKLSAPNNKFDLVVCDLKMPGMDGLTLYNESKKVAPHVPFMLITGYPEREKILEAIRAGVRDVLLKPVKHGDLLEKIQQNIGEDADEGSSSQAA